MKQSEPFDHENILQLTRCVWMIIQRLYQPRSKRRASGDNPIPRIYSSLEQLWSPAAGLRMSRPPIANPPSCLATVGRGLEEVDNRSSPQESEIAPDTLPSCRIKSQ